MIKKIFYISFIATTALFSCKSGNNVPLDIPAKENIQNTVSVESEIKFDDENFDFANVKKGEQVTHKFSFTNVGDKPLIITEVRPSCGCTTPLYTTEPVAPGKKGSVVVTFDSTGFEGNVVKSVRVSGNFKPTEIKFKANIIK